MNSAGVALSDGGIEVAEPAILPTHYVEMVPEAVPRGRG